MAHRNKRRVWWIEPGTGQQRSRTLATEHAAMRFAEDREEDARLVRDGRLTARQVEVATGRASLLSDAVDEYNEDRRHRGVTETEITDSTTLIELVFAKCKWGRVNDVDPVQLKRVIQKLAKDRKWSARTVNRYGQCLGGLFNNMVLGRLLDENPTTALSVLNDERDRRRISRALTVPESDAMVDEPAVESPPAHAKRRLLYLTRARTGIRVLEASRLDWSDLDMEHGLIRLRANMTKNSKADEIPIAADLLDAIADYQQFSIQHGRIFPVVPAKETWRRDLDRAGVAWEIRGERAEPKCLRKTFESHLLRSGCDPIICMLLMRHSPRGGMGLTMGTYADQGELLRRKRAAIKAMTAWQQEQRKATRKATA